MGRSSRVRDRETVRASGQSVREASGTRAFIPPFGPIIHLEYRVKARQEPIHTHAQYLAEKGPPNVPLGVRRKRDEKSLPERGPPTLSWEREARV